MLLIVEQFWLQVELCKAKIDSLPLQTEMYKPICYTCFLWYKAHMVVLYANFEKLCLTKNLFYIKILKQQVDYVKKTWTVLQILD